jgi:MFS family permease
MNRRRAEHALLLAIFLDLLGFGMIVADFQLRAERLIPRDWPVGAVIGALLGSTFVIQLLVSPRWGRLSDERGRKPVILLCGLLSAFAMIVYGFAWNVLWLLVSRVLAGLGSANVAVAQAWISDETDGEGRTAALGRISAAIGAGLIMGPPLGGFLSLAGGPEALGFTAGGAALLGMAAVAVALPTVPPREAREPGRRPAIDLSLLRDFPALRPMVTIAAVAWFSLATLEGTFARLIRSLFGYGQMEFGWIFGYESLIGILVAAKALGWLAKRVPEGHLLRAAYVGQGIGLALNPFAGGVAALSPLVVLFVASTAYAVGSGLANPTINAICSRLTPSKRQGELFGLLQGSRAIGFVVGPIVGGWLFDRNPIAPYLLAGSVCLLAAIGVPRESRAPEAA